MSSRGPGEGEGSRERGSSPVPGDAELARRREDEAAKAKMLRITGTYSYIGIEFGVAIALGWFGGGWLIERYGWPSWARYALMGLGLVAAFRDLFRLVRRTDLDRMDDPR